MLFLSTPSARRATPKIDKLCRQHQYFYPRPPRGGRPFQTTAGRQVNAISIHALREEGDSRGQQARGVTKVFLSTPSARRATLAARCDCIRLAISIHALREEGDGMDERRRFRNPKFLSTPSARRATVSVTPYNGSMFTFLSTPSARRATDQQAEIDSYLEDFYPRPPRGGRQGNTAALSVTTIFLSTPSARRAT